MVSASVSTIKGGAMNEISVMKSLRLSEIAYENRLPCIALIQSVRLVDHDTAHGTRHTAMVLIAVIFCRLEPICGSRTKCFTEAAQLFESLRSGPRPACPPSASSLAAARPVFPPPLSTRDTTRDTTVSVLCRWSVQPGYVRLCDHGQESGQGFPWRPSAGEDGHRRGSR